MRRALVYEIICHFFFQHIKVIDFYYCFSCLSFGLGHRLIIFKFYHVIILTLFTAFICQQIGWNDNTYWQQHLKKNTIDFFFIRAIFLFENMFWLQKCITLIQWFFLKLNLYSSPFHNFKWDTSKSVNLFCWFQQTKRWFIHNKQLQMIMIYLAIVNFYNLLMCTNKKNTHCSNQNVYECIW